MQWYTAHQQGSGEYSTEERERQIMVEVAAGSFAELLKHYRAAAGLTQEMLAEREGLSARGISDLERGVKQRPYPHTVHRLIQALALGEDEAARFQRAGLSVRAVRDIETGSQHRPRADTVELLLDALESSAEDRAAFKAAEESGGTFPGAAQELPIGGFLGALPVTPLVGREHEFQLVLDQVEAVTRGAGRFVLLAGEPGAGKTRLAQEATLHLHAGDFLVAAGRCYEPEQTVPYYPFLDLLTMVYTAAPPALARDAARRWPYLGALLPDQLGVPELAGDSGQDEQQRVFRAVTGFLEAVSARRHLALLLDDLHWADSSSLKLLLHLARHTRTLPILILGTYRDVDVGRHHPLEGALRDLGREDLLERMEVSRLDPASTAALVAALLGEEQVSAEFAALVYGRTEGNPYFVQQVLQVLMERGDLFRIDGGWDRRAIQDIAVPESVRSVVGQRLARLSALAQEVLREASVLGQTFAFADLEAVSAQDERELEEAVEETCQVGLVRDVGSDRYSFDHALTQQSIYGELPSRRKRRLHLAAAEVLEHLPERLRKRRAAEIATHFLHSTERAKALPYALQAGDDAEAVFAHEEAEEHYRIALELVREVEDPPREAAVLEKLGHVLLTLARYGEALEILEQGVNAYRTAGDCEGVDRTTARIGRAYFLQGTPDNGIARIRPLLDRPEPTQLSPARAALYVALAPLLWASGRFEEQRATAERAATLARAVGDDRILVEAELWRGYALCAMDHNQDGAVVLETMLPLAESAGDLTSLARALNALAVTYELSGEFAKAEPYLERAIVVAEQLGDPTLIAYLLYRRSMQDFRLDNWERARRAAEQAVDVNRKTGQSWASPYPLIGLGSILLAQGERELGNWYICEGIVVAEQNRDGRALRNARVLLATWDVLEGRPEAALERLRESDGGNADGGENEWLPDSWPLAAEAYLQLHELSTARRLVEHTFDVAASADDRRLRLEGMRVLAGIAAAEGRQKEAESVLESALTLARDIGHVYAIARVLYGYGALEKGAAAQVRPRLEEALVLFRRLGAQPYIERTECTLAEFAEV